jgi:hypothetical protein
MYPLLDIPVTQYTAESAYNDKNNAVLLEILDYLATQEGKQLSLRFLIYQVNAIFEKNQLTQIDPAEERAEKYYKDIDDKVKEHIRLWESQKDKEYDERWSCVNRVAPMLIYLAGLALSIW